MKTMKKEGRTPVHRFITEWILPILIAVIAAILLNKFVYFKIDVPSSSMYPTIAPQNKIFVRRVYKKENLKRGDILVFRSTETEDPVNKEKLLIKRLIGLPGDKIEINGNEVRVNGEVLNEPYVVNKETSSMEKTFNVPEGQYFFLGDNRPNSFDSRRWKNPYVKADDIVAIAGLRIAPLSNFGFLK